MNEYSGLDWDDIGCTCEMCNPPAISPKEGQRLKERVKALENAVDRQQASIDRMWQREENLLDCIETLQTRDNAHFAKIESIRAILRTITLGDVAKLPPGAGQKLLNLACTL